MNRMKAFMVVAAATVAFTAVVSTFDTADAARRCKSGILVLCLRDIALFGNASPVTVSGIAPYIPAVGRRHGAARLRHKGSQDIRQ